MNKIIERFSQSAFKINLTYFCIFLMCADGYLLFNRISGIRNEYVNGLYYIQDDFSNNKYEETLIGSNDHRGLFELINEANNKSSINTLNLYTGICLSKLGHYMEGINHLKGVNVSDDFLKAKINVLIGDCYTDLSEYDKALESFLMSLKLAEKSDEMASNIVYKIVLIYEEKGMYDKALELLKKTIRKSKSKGYSNSLLIDEKKKIQMLMKKI